MRHLYEIRIGCFTPRIVFWPPSAEQSHLIQVALGDDRIDAGVELPDRRGWGYDGSVLPFAPEDQLLERRRFETLSLPPCTCAS
jgi:1,4-alpha-glucan branching enzyme